jgi:mRNA-degrading endonuclease YafQ of YafQ-DinJ toxin-antitoxin module
MKYSVAYSNKFKKDYKLIIKQGKDISKLQAVVAMLQTENLYRLSLKTIILSVNMAATESAT